MADSGSRSRPGAGPDLRWLDLLKAVAICWIFLNHFSEQLFGGPYFGNPYNGWPPLGERIAQLAPMRNAGEWNLPANLLRYVGWCGDQGVQLFLIASGFGLTWGLLRREAGNSLELGDFYRRRGKRVLPLWWTAHIFFFLTWLVTGWGMSLAKSASYLSFFGLRITLKSFYYFAPAWWFIGLLLQLYLVYPFLWSLLKKKGPLWLLVVGSSVSLVVRGVGLGLLESHLDFWSRGGFLVTRLPEFLFGMCLAAWYFRSPEEVDRRLKQPSTILGALVLYGAGTFLSFFLLGMTVAPLLVGVGAFLVLYPLLAWLGAHRGSGVGVWVGRHSYSLFLMHHPFILLVVPLGYGGLTATVLRSISLAVALTVITAILFEGVASLGSVFLGRASSTGRLAWVQVGCVILAIAGGSTVIWAEMLVRERAPQEVYGWGERPSLEPHELFGWRMRPSTRTRLRWESYDYTVTANSLGFPGREYPESRSPGVSRILVIGDAFTSAEGVDTDSAWPWLLESKINERSQAKSAEVLNFAITGYGPRQFAAVIEEFAVRFKPDQIVIGFFVNEFQDVLISDSAFREGIGFGRRSPDDWCTILDRPHLVRFMRVHVFEPIYSAIIGRPSRNGYFLGGFSALETHPEFPRDSGRKLVAKHLSQIDRVADRIDAEVLLLLIPAPVQVCLPEQLRYFPPGTDLSDTAKFDLDLPQRETTEIASSLGFGILDLRPTLSLEKTGGECVFQTRNLHWTEEGHRRVADALAGRLVGSRR